MVYNRDVVVNCLKRYYDLFVRMAYIEPDIVQQPPLDGWNDEQLDVDSLRAHGFTENVIGLLRHIPYLKKKPNVHTTEVWIYTEPLSYLRTGNIFTGREKESCRGRDEDGCLLSPFEVSMPRSFIPLTFGREATWWVIDTDQGMDPSAGTA